MSSNTNSMISSSKKLITAAASLAATAVLVRLIASDLLPCEVRDYIFSALEDLRNRLSSQLTIVVQEFEGDYLATNKLFAASEAYLATKIPPSARRIRARKREQEKSVEISIEPGQVIVDTFRGIQFRWKLIHQEILKKETRHSFELTFDRKHKSTALGPYFEHIMERSSAIKEEEKTLQIHTRERDNWFPINLRHPARFETLAMDSELKTVVMEDLTRFVKRKEYYRRIGKAWKRGYLLYGPPGTGKSSLIAAMANFLKFDIYDLELSKVKSNSTLRKLLLGTANRSILVVEDIDCSTELENREQQIRRPQDIHSSTQITLSGLLNFVDGLWSSCGEERIIIFTTNYKDRIDPALLRPGRMDMHIHMGYCGPRAFRVLASNYHAIDQHHLFGEIEELRQEVDVTPAEVAEELMRSDDVDVALRGLTNLLRGRKKDVGETGDL